MYLFDSHCHLQDQRISGDVDGIINRAAGNNVHTMMCCGSAESDWNTVREICRRYQSVLPSFGYHPWYIAGRSDTWTDVLEEVLTEFPNAGVGEIGLDFVIENADRADMIAVFVGQLELAKKYNRAVTIHCRKAWGELVRILEETGIPAKGGVVHSYSGSPELLPRLEKIGLYISFSGSITFERNKRVRESIQCVGEDHLLIETDSPDILPLGAMGQHNEPANLSVILDTAAAIRGVSIEHLANITNDNAEKLFM